MTTLCPKCQHVRADDAAVPSWQCPACGVAYAKAASGASASHYSTRPSPLLAQPLKDDAGLPWGKLLLVVAVACGLWFGHRASQEHRSGESSIASIAARLSGATSEADLHVVVATVKAGDVTMYTTTHCPYCAQARGWLNQNGFAFTECDAEVRQECASDMQMRNAKGVPFLIVRGKPMNDGFDSDEFVALLSKR